MTHSVVIPLYNKAAYVEHTLLSLARQVYSPTEIIIVDDASTDGSLAVVYKVLEKEQRAFKNTRVEVVQLAHNRGPGFARNRGFEKSTGQIVSFLDADDTYISEFLSTVQCAMLKHNVDFLVVGIRYIPSGLTDPEVEKLQGMLTPIGANLFLMDNPLQVVTTPSFVMGVGSNVVAKRAWMERVQFDEDVLLNEGIDYWYRVLKEGNRFGKPRAALLMGEHLHVREVPNSLSRKKYEHWQEIDYPPVLRRYHNSDDAYDQRLMLLIGTRWFRYSITSLCSTKQKILFVFHYWNFFVRHSIRLFTSLGNTP